MQILRRMSFTVELHLTRDPKGDDLWSINILGGDYALTDYHCRDLIAGTEGAVRHYLREMHDAIPTQRPFPKAPKDADK